MRRWHSPKPITVIALKPINTAFVWQLSPVSTSPSLFPDRVSGYTIFLKVYHNLAYYLCSVPYRLEILQNGDIVAKQWFPQMVKKSKPFTTFSFKKIQIITKKLLLIRFYAISSVPSSATTGEAKCTAIMPAYKTPEVVVEIQFYTFAFST